MSAQISALFVPLLPNVISLLAFVCTWERERGREMGARERAVLEQSGAKEHICLGLTYVNCCYPSGKFERIIKGKKRRI